MIAHNADGRRKLLEEAKSSGVHLDMPAYTVLLGSLRIEGRDEEVDAVLAEARAAGLEPNERTNEVLQRSEDDLGRLRTGILKKLLRDGRAKRSLPFLRHAAASWPRKSWAFGRDDAGTRF